MRRIMWMAAMVACVAVLLAGCGLGLKNADSVVKDLDKTVSGLQSYKGTGTMTLHTGTQPLEYRVEVWYQKPQYYRIALTNAKKDITQIVLRNDEGVFVLTPSLNKSFRFQSDWPQNQGQVYLFQTLAQSILLDNSRKFTTDKDAYVFDVMANYQNSSLARQKIWLDKKTLAPQHVEVSDSNAAVMVDVAFDSFTFGDKFQAGAFDTAANMGGQKDDGGASSETPNTGSNKGEAAPAPGGNGGKSATDGTAKDGSGAAGADQGKAGASGDGADAGANAGDTAADGSGSAADQGAADQGAAGDGKAADGDNAAAAQPSGSGDGAESAAFTAMEPTYLPEGVSSTDMQEITFGGSKGFMIRYGGDYDYTLIETRPKDRDAALVPGDVIDLGYTVGLLTGDEQKTLTWTYGGVEYRLTSGNLPDNEMIRVAQSVDAELGK